MDDPPGTGGDVIDAETDVRSVGADCGLHGPESHLALIYESQAEQFATVTGFVRTGLERGERCLYVVDDNTTSEVVDAMEEAGIDVSAARSSGQLSLHSPTDVYDGNGAFDGDATIRYFEDLARSAVDEDGFDHVRFTGEMTWALDEDDRVQHALSEYEAKLNAFNADAAATCLCQYSRERFPPAVLEDVLRTHPQVAFDGTRRRNVYYRPPTAALTPDERSAIVDRRLRAIRDRGDQRTRLGELGSLVQAVIGSVTAASTREGIDQAVCDHLTDVEPWEFAWVGETSASSERVTPRASSGDGDAYLDDVTVPVTADAPAEPAGRAAAARSAVVVRDVETVPAETEWRERLRERDLGAVASVPLVYEGISYGVLSVYGGGPGAFPERAQAVLDDVGRAVAFACNALERREALVSDRATELEIRLPGDDPFVDFATRLEAGITIDGLVPESGPADDGADRHRVFFTVDGATSEAVDAAAAEAGPFSSTSLIAEQPEGAAYDGVVDEPELLGTVLDHAVVPKSVVPDGESGRVVVLLPPSTDVASFVRMLQDRYPGAELIARRDVESRPTGRSDFRTELRDRLTDRQWDALQTAYLSGYFEWPRERSGEEVGDRLDVSQPTFNRHLRDGLRKFMEPIFGDDR